MDHQCRELWRRKGFVMSESVVDGTVNPLTRFSRELAEVTKRTGESVVSVDDGARLTASGVVWSADGVIVATSHGVERDEELFVVTGDGTRYPATLVGRDDGTDIAVLKIEANDLPAITAATDPDAGLVGTLALAVARPGGTHLTVTLGVVGGRHETETDGAPEYILYTDATLYPGASGGALIDAGTGEFLGLLDRLYGRGAGVALGAPLVARVVSALLAHGRVPRGYLGVRTQVVPIPTSLRNGLNIGQEYGLLVAGVAGGSPAETGGVLLGDTLIALNGESVQDIDDLRRFLKAGQEINLQIVRGGALTEITVTVGAEKAGDK